MCGIFGFTGIPDTDLLTRMGNVVVHRGPDDAGFWSEEGISLGMRRLSIIDLESGHQPATSQDGNFKVVFNGEIYNHVELRARLEAQGHRFRSQHSDTEVIPHLFQRYGTDFLSHLNGMFAIAIWDRRKKELFLARDHSGIKPLYYTVVGGECFFASEIKSLLRHPRVAKRPDFKALHHYFSFKNIPSPYSAFEGIRQLRPGEWLLFKNGEVETKRWWRLRYQEDPGLTEMEASEEILRLLRDSVKLQSRSDVPIGAYLSGGVDSSSVVALMAEAGGQVKTFTLAYEDEFKNKAADVFFARKVSGLYRTEHHEYVISHREIPECIPQVIASFDEPFSGTVSTYFLTKLISQHVKVALSGDGADELFGSYLPHRLAIPLSRFAALAQKTELTHEEKASLAPFSDQIEFLRSVYDRKSEAARRMAQFVWRDEQKAQLYSEAMLDYVAGESTYALIEASYEASGTTDPLNRALFVDFEMLLPDQVLAFSDRLSMAHSVESRPPFLDHRLIEFAAKIPGEMKIKNGRVKHILKEAVKSLLPAEILDRPKEGFVLPTSQWLIQSLQGYAREVLSEARLKRHGLWRTEKVQELLRDLVPGKPDSGNQVWNLMMFQIWWEKYFG